MSLVQREIKQLFQRNQRVLLVPTEISSSLSNRLIQLSSHRLKTVSVSLLQQPAAQIAILHSNQLYSTQCRPTKAFKHKNSQLPATCNCALIVTRAHYFWF